jgi:murein DD-endopeptidase MepM/ murein hydrolase activator NlpD
VSDRRSGILSSVKLRPFAAICLTLTLARCTIDEKEPVRAPEPPRPRQDYATPIGPDPPIAHERLAGTLEKRDSLSKAMIRLGVSAAEVDEVVKALKGVFDFRKCRIGHAFEIEKDTEGRLSWFRYTADAVTTAIAFRASNGAMKGYLDPVKVTSEAVMIDGRISYSLYEAMEEAGEQPQLVLSFVDLFAWDVDFFTETQEGDAFRIVVEKRFVDGKMIGYGRILGAEYAMASGKTQRAFFFEHADGTTGYYSENGASVRKAFLKSPIQFASITSRYGMRRHPILNYVRAHRGVDYGAPAGTAVWAVGDGVVRSAGPSGGYGNMIAIRHTNGLETRYAHLRAFASGVRSGRRISQKQVIGYVGSTGLSTGPHLHFEVLRSGQWTNPLKVSVPPAPPIGPAETEAFTKAIAPYAERIAEAARRSMARAAEE